MARKKPSNGEKTGRDPKTGRFTAGNTGGGRKQIPKDIKDMFEAATPDAVKLLVETINDPAVRRETRVRCCEIVLDRHLGKPVQAVDLDTKTLPQVVFVGVDAIPD